MPNFPILAAAMLVLAGPSGRALAQTDAIPVELPADDSPRLEDGRLTPPQLERLVAPYALYPDPLLTDILAASTYPAQIQAAANFVGDPANAGLRGDAMTQATADRHWDPSVQALLAFPQVLAKLNDRLGWTDRLGQAFVAQQAEVLDAVQRLRARAEAAGSLANGPQDSVVNEGGTIAILPPSPQEVFVPQYDADCVYGGVAGCDGAIGWGDVVVLPYGYAVWGRLDWRRHGIWLEHGATPRAGRYGDDPAAAAPGGGDGGAWHHEGGHVVLRQGPAATPFQYAPPAGRSGEERAPGGFARGPGIGPGFTGLRGGDAGRHPASPTAPGGGFHSAGLHGPAAPAAVHAPAGGGHGIGIGPR